jgi:phage gpG-like protein
MIGAAQNVKPVWETVGRVISNRIKLGFRGSMSPHGMPWLPLKTRVGKPLLDTGRLRRSILYVADNAGVEIGTNLKYAPVHQFGATIIPKNGPFLAFKVFKATAGEHFVLAKKVTVPARPFMPISKDGALDLPPAWSRSVLEAMASHLKVGT